MRTRLVKSISNKQMEGGEGGCLSVFKRHEGAQYFYFNGFVERINHLNPD